MQEAINKYSGHLHKVVAEIGKVIIGKQQAVELVLLSLISGGHVLIEDIPGVGKTSLVSALAGAVDCKHNRIQFTPDIMPSDITGFSIYNQKTGEFEFRPGAAMSNFILADEINRASAKAQASLLEVMEEKQVTIDSTTYKMEEPFMVLATQNPVDNLGTYPLPEAQIDRFIIKISLGYPSPEEEQRIMSMKKSDKVIVDPVINGKDIVAVRKCAETIKVEDLLKKYITDIVCATRNHPDIILGASPRGSIFLYKMAQSLALYEGRHYATPDDIKKLASYVLSHRLILTHSAKSSGMTQEKIISAVLDSVPVPL